MISFVSAAGLAIALYACPLSAQEQEVGLAENPGTKSAGKESEPSAPGSSSGTKIKSYEEKKKPKPKPENAPAKLDESAPTEPVKN